MPAPDIRGKAEKDRNWLEQKLRAIPGFHGYLEKEERRNTDRILREHLAGRLDRLRERLDPVMRDLSDRGGFDMMDLTAKVDRVKKALERLVARVRYASYGYSGVFDAVKVREKELDRLYEFDLALMERIEALGEVVAEIGEALSSPDRMKEAIDAALDLAREFDEHFDGRTQLITTEPEE